MKKKYVNPKLNIEIIQQEQDLLTTSSLGIGDPGSANAAESRRHGRTDWDDEEDY